MMAVASSRRGDRSAAVEHLRHAVTLNPENRALARQDPDLDALRELEAFRDDARVAGAGRRPAKHAASPATQDPALARFHRPATAGHCDDPPRKAPNSCQMCIW